MVSRLVFFTLSALASLASVSAEGLLLKITGPTHVDDISGLQIKATLKNTGRSALTLVNDPRSILSTTPTNTFSISHESGANPAFKGILVKFSHAIAIQKGAVTTLNPGQSIDVTHSLAGTYDFTHPGPGTYQISPSSLFHAVSQGGSAQPMYATLENSHTVIMSGSGRLAVPRESGQQKRDILLTKGGTVVACNATQETQINAAIPAAVTYVNTAIAYLNSHPSATTRFTTWFGTFSAANRATILNHFTSLTTNGTFTSWTYECGGTDCEPGDLAYVDSDVYGYVHLCSEFWPSPTTGTDSNGGTLVHEGTHFTATASTEDYAYGQDDCKQLAITNPAQARMNADSHEYFAENNPPLA